MLSMLVVKRPLLQEYARSCQRGCLVNLLPTATSTTVDLTSVHRRPCRHCQWRLQRLRAPTGWSSSDLTWAPLILVADPLRHSWLRDKNNLHPRTHCDPSHLFTFVLLSSFHVSSSQQQQRRGALAGRLVPVRPILLLRSLIARRINSEDVWAFHRHTVHARASVRPPRPDDPTTGGGKRRPCRPPVS